MNKRIAVLVSGTGSLLDAMIKDGLPIDLVVADRPCRGIDVVTLSAQPAIPAAVLYRASYGKGLAFKRELYTAWLTDFLERFGIDIVVMAGFMTVLSPMIFEPRHYGGRILNSHPSLLPLFKGDRAVRDALASGVQITGTTIHVATPEVDSGPILAQEEVPILDGDTEGTLHERIKQVERVLYPKTIRAFAAHL
ncbi:phosphoribosylglycinamide formyltransferase [Candidatus Kaiserbacteria bacterium]|nr:phosphoribosylglycinamide formyltransferase [Candidatus Kaiserbacteria bacterium]